MMDIPAALLPEVGQPDHRDQGKRQGHHQHRDLLNLAHVGVDHILRHDPQHHPTLKTNGLINQIIFIRPDPKLCGARAPRFQFPADPLRVAVFKRRIL